ncbi:EcsC family protein [Angustibacter sp. McL0619]|uniref:EcsC family protein n=1 Tax=Angustibacter sp. McL0619 TaxID=3415676 RepID=UPI003CF08BCF
MPEEDDVLQESDVEPGDKGIAAQASVMAAQAGAFVDKLLDVGIDGRGPFDSAQNVADGALSGHGDAEQAIDAVIRSHVRAAAAGGFVTGLGGFFTLPLALPVNVLEFYAIATRMVATVACLRGYDLRQQGVRSAVLLTLVGADAEDLLRGAGVQHSGRLAGLATSRLPGPALMVLNKAIGFRLVARVGRSAAPRLGRGVPIVGGVLGAGFDVFLLRRIADQARREFPHAPAALGR